MRFVRDNGIALFFGVILLGSLVGQSFAGLHQFNANAIEHHASTYTWFRYVTSSEFGGDVFENWQSEFLQVFVFIVLTTFLVHRKSHESPDTDYDTEAALRRIEAKLDRLERERTTA